jgi:excisionase family DNA binding protein
MTGYISTTEAAKLMGISRVAVYQQIKRGTLPADRVGRNYLIDPKRLPYVIERELTDAEKARVGEGVRRVVKQYGRTLKWLADE